MHLQHEHGAIDKDSAKNQGHLKDMTSVGFSPNNFILVILLKKTFLLILIWCNGVYISFTRFYSLDTWPVGF